MRPSAASVRARRAPVVGLGGRELHAPSQLAASSSVAIARDRRRAAGAVYGRADRQPRYHDHYEIMTLLTRLNEQLGITTRS
jgi:hypothetical protein